MYVLVVACSSFVVSHCKMEYYSGDTKLSLVLGSVLKLASAILVIIIHGYGVDC